MHTISRFRVTLFAVTLLLFAGLQSTAALAAATPTSDFTVNGDGSTVTHKTTGLTWKRCAEGQTWTGSTCSGTAQRYTWYAAMALGVNKGWGLPTKDQLLAIEETGHVAPDPTVNAAIFPNTPADWTWSASELNSFSALFVSFYTAGSFSDTAKEGSGYYVRLVQGGQVLDPSATTGNFTINGDGSTVTDKTTGLTWKRCAEGQTWTGSTCSGTAQRYTWTTAMSLGAYGWGLPTKDQLLTLVEMNHASPFINQTIFPNPPVCQTWSASEYATDPASAWYVGICNPNDSNGTLKNNTNLVRLVQGGQSRTLISLSGLSLTCPSTINASATGLCSATASYSDGASKAVSGYNWSTSNPSVLNLSSERLTAGLPTSDTVVIITFTYTENGVSKTATANVTVKAAGPLLTGLTATCPSTINAGTSATCTATASYNDGSSKVVSAIWNSTIARTTLGIDPASGMLTAGMPNVDTVVTILADYTENNIYKSTSVSVTVKPAVAVLTGLTAGCSDTSINAGASFTCNATAGYSNGHYNVVSPTWSSSNTAMLSVDSSGKIVAGKPNVDTVVMISASYSEGGVSKTASVTVTVKAAPLVLMGLTVTCPKTLNAGASATCYATASYNNGSNKAVNPTWYSTNSTALSVSGGGLVAGKPTSDTVVTISAIYTENGVSKSTNATVTVVASTVNTPPTTPTGFSARITGTGTGMLSWNASSDPERDAIAYRVQASLDQIHWSADKTTRNLSTPLVTTSFAGNTAYLRVRAEDTKNNFSNWVSTQLSVPGSAQLAAPQISVSPNPAPVGAKVSLTFSPVASATSYKLYYGSAPGVYSQSFQVWSPYQFDMLAGLDIYMVVKAVNGNVESLASNEVHLTAASQINVTRISPSSVALNKMTQFTVEGTGLVDGMGFSIQDCDTINFEVGIGSSTKRTFSCTVTETVGNKLVTVTNPVGDVISSNLVVSATPADAFARCDASLSNDFNTLTAPVLIYHSGSRETIAYATSFHYIGNDMFELSSNALSDIDYMNFVDCNAGSISTHTINMPVINYLGSTVWMTLQYLGNTTGKYLFKIIGYGNN